MSGAVSSASGVSVEDSVEPETLDFMSFNLSGKKMIIIVW